MEEFITDERTGLRYGLVGDYYLIAGEDEPEGRPIGIWGQRHLRYIRKHKVSLYAELLTTGKLNDYLADLNEQAEAMFSRLVKQLFEKRGRNGSPQSGKSNAVGAEDEQHPQCCYGKRCKRFDLRITNNRKGCCQQTAAFPLRVVFKKS